MENHRAEASPKYRSVSKITSGHIREKSIVSERGWGEFAWQNVNWKFEKIISRIISGKCLVPPTTRLVK